MSAVTEGNFYSYKENINWKESESSCLFEILSFPQAALSRLKNSCSSCILNRTTGCLPSALLSLQPFTHLHGLQEFLTGLLITTLVDLMADTINKEINKN